ncbi:hypothetical protein Tco_1196088 [Tanacetum coccineum]
MTITNMLNKKLQADHQKEINLKIQKMNIKFRGGLLGLKDFMMILGVTTAQSKVATVSIKLVLRVLTTAYAQLVLLVIKIQLLSDYNYWKDYTDRDEIKDMSKKK